MFLHFSTPLLRRSATCALAVIAMCTATLTAAQVRDGPTRVDPLTEIRTPFQLEGTLAKIARSGSIVLGHRDSSVPFSYIDAQREPIGYAIDLCKNVVTALSSALNQPISIHWQGVTSDTRIDAVASGEVDLECGSTTSNLERQARVAFSPIYFVAGTKVLVKSNSDIRGFRQLAAKRIAVTEGTTNAAALERLSKQFDLNIQLLPVRDHLAGFNLVKSGGADAYATDDVLLYGLIAEYAKEDASSYRVVGDYLSYDPYGAMFRRDDPQFAKFVTDSFDAMARSGEIERLYNRWFLRPLPSGINLDLPMSAQLSAILQTMAKPPE